MEQDSSCPQEHCGCPVVGASSAISSSTSALGAPSEHPGRDPLGNGVAGPSANPFTSPSASRPASSLGSSALRNRSEEHGKRYFHSRKLKSGDMEKPWLKKRDPKEKWITIFPLVGIFVGLGISGFLIYDGISSVVKHKYCLILSDDFSGGFNTDVWTKEVQVGGFGNGEFEMTTDENVFIRDGNLVIKPTLQDPQLIESNNTAIYLLKDGTCTSDSGKDCIATTTSAPGNSTMVPPTRSGRINTKKGAAIKYGRVEVTARLPRGDWLWPAIWMLPTQDTYGPWPASGEIDVAESRGNDHTYPQGGNHIVSSALHWGPDPDHDAWWQTNAKRSALHSTYAEHFHTFGLEWSREYLFTYVDSRLLQVLYANFDRPMWKRGGFPPASANGTRIQDVWSQMGRHNTPFDRAFYLVLNVAVGGTNGWFEDGVHGKPWVDDSHSAKKDFWKAQGDWFPTWTRPEMEISKVMMWQQCDGDEDL